MTGATPPLADLLGTLRLPREVHVGEGVRARLPEVVRTLGSTALFVVDPFLIGSRVLAELVDSVVGQGLEVVIFSDVEAELPVDGLVDAGNLAREVGADLIVAVGGGSALDAAKCIALVASHGGPLSRMYGENQVPGPVLPLVALPTTAGTGSEVTPVAVVTDVERAQKVGISSPYLVPTVALVDPDLAAGAPAAVTAHAGIDAVVHAVESYTARPLQPVATGMPVATGRNALSDPMALSAVAHLGPWLSRAVAAPQDRVARQHTVLGSLSAGIAFGSTGVHLCHALQYPVGAASKTPHGLGTGLLLPYAIDTLRQDAATSLRLSQLGAAMEAIPAAEASAERLLDRVVHLNRAIGIPATLAEIGIGRDQLPELAERAFGSARLLAVSPVEATTDVLRDLLERAHAGVLDRRPVSGSW